MKVPLRWLEDYVDIDVTPVELARKMTFAGLEVEAMHYLGRPRPEGTKPGDPEHPEAKLSGLEWKPEHLVVGAIQEVEPHPDADRLVLAKVDDGATVNTVVTGAPNLYEYKGKGPLDPPLKIAFAREGTQLYDGHKSGQHLMKLKRAKIRGIESSSMVCSEKELGISDEHEGVILFDDDAPAPGTPLVDYIGDIVFDISITPNMSRNACVLGTAREVAAILGKELKEPDLDVVMEGPPTKDAARIEIRQSELNPRFTFTLLEGAEIKPSPYWLQLRLRLAGMRPISNIVDLTNYVMLEIGQPLHAFDYDILVQRAKTTGQDVPTIITRFPEPGEELKTLDGVERKLDDFTILVGDTVGVLALGGIMGGAESEVSERTTNVLLEAASWNMINVRRSVQAQQLQTSEAGYRFSRGVHPEHSLRGNLRAIEMMRQIAGGVVRKDVLDVYPAPPEPVTFDFPLAELPRYLGVDIPRGEVLAILDRLEFGVEDQGETLRITVPDHRVDVDTGVIGIADLIEEISRVWGYENIPLTQISDTIPPQHGNPDLEHEEDLRDLLVELGLQEIISYRITSPERERRALVADAHEAAAELPYTTLANPIVVDRTVMRRALLPNALEIAEANVRFCERLALFEIGKVFLPREGEPLPEEPRRLLILLSGPRVEESWTGADMTPMDFFDLKGVVERMAAGLHLENVGYERAESPSLHPGKCARLVVNGDAVGVFGELHPRVQAGYELPDLPVLVADLDAEALLAAMPRRFETGGVSRYPAVKEDIALVVDEAVPSADVETLIVQTGGKRLKDARLFDLYRSEQIGAGKKSLAYRLTYQSDEGTLTDKDAEKIRKKILKRLEREVGAVLRG